MNVFAYPYGHHKCQSANTMRINVIMPFMKICQGYIVSRGPQFAQQKHNQITNGSVAQELIERAFGASALSHWILIQYQLIMMMNHHSLNCGR